MQMNVLTFPSRFTGNAANDDGPAGPGGNVVSASELRRSARMIRTLRGMFFADGAQGLALAA